MKSFLLAVPAVLLFCQCESVPPASSPDRRPSLTESGLSPAERVRAEKNRPLSTDPNDPLSKVRTKDGAVGLKVMEF